jgi:hypothetical protein
MCGGGGGGGPVVTWAEKANAEIATDQWDDYQTRFVPFENQFIADTTGGSSVDGQWADNGTTAIKQDIVGGRVNADVAGQNNGAIPVGKINQIGATASGYDTPQMAAAGANAVSTATGRVRDAQVQGMLSAINVGRGQAAGAIESMGNIAADAADQAQTNAEASFNRNAANESAIGSGVGAAAAATGEALRPTRA